MEYNKDEMIQDYVARSVSNLSIIREAVRDGKKGPTRDANGYEVTQLINSMVAMVILPREKAFNQIPEKSFEDLGADGWPQRLLADTRCTKTLRTLVRRVRNAVAHFNIGFYVDDDGYLAGLWLWNTYRHKKKRKKCWEAKITISDLEFLVDRLEGIWKKEFSAANNFPIAPLPREMR